MNVERLMMDLHIEQLQDIYSKLSIEMEEKKEELRQMVGRRYRDVLDASSAVRHVTQIADSLFAAIHDSRTPAILNVAPIHTSAINRLTSIRLMAFCRLLRNVNTADPVSNVFIFLIIENIHRELSTDSPLNDIQSNVVSMATEVLIRMRLTIEEQLIHELETSFSINDTLGRLIAIGLLKQLSLKDLFLLYIERKKIAMRNSFESSLSLVDTLWHLRSIFACSQHLFADGFFAAAMRTIGKHGWKPKALDSFLLDETLATEKFLESEIEYVNERCNLSDIGFVDKDFLVNQSAQLMRSICEVSRNAMVQCCEQLDSTQSLLTFITVLKDVFDEDWPIVGDRFTLYHDLFGDVVITKFKSLIDLEFHSFEISLLDEIDRIQCHPVNLFKKRSFKFDLLLATGVSNQLLELVKGFNESLNAVFERVRQYESFGHDKSIGSLSKEMSDTVCETLRRLCEAGMKKAEEKDASKEQCLSIARLYICLLQHTLPTVCPFMTKNEAIVFCSNQLHAAIDKGFCVFCDKIIEQCRRDSEIEFLCQTSSDFVAFMSIVQKYQSIDLPDVGTIEVPLNLNRILFSFIYDCCREISEHSVGHLLSRSVRSHIAEKIVTVVSTVYSSILSVDTKMNSFSLSQYLFDLRVVNSIFPTDSLKSLIHTVEARMDPFDLSLLTRPLSKNARTAVQRYSVLFAYILLDPVAYKDCSPEESYLAVVDILPRVTDIPRISLIPRLTAQEKDNAFRPTFSASNVAAGNKKESFGNLASAVKSTPSFSSFYKLSQNWFGN